MAILESLLILGYPRSGKTSLGNMAADRLNLGLISTDAIIQTFKSILPELNMHHGPEKSEATFAPFLFKYMDWTMYKPAYNLRRYVFEGCNVFPKTADRMMDKEKYNLVVLGCPNLTPERFVAAIRKNDKPWDWSFKKTGDELYSLAQGYINEAKRLESECMEIDAKFIDTSFDREARLGEFADSLESFLL